MKPTQILMDEHRVIEQVLDCLEKMARHCQTTGALNAQQAKDAVEFFRNFADRCHHGKEEARLFPLMEARGFPREGGPTGVMMHEHDLGRAHVRGMDEAIDAAAAGDAPARQQFIEHAVGYIELLRGHIQKEDHCLFPMAEQAMSDQDRRDLLDAFDHVEHEEMGTGTHERFLKIANDLAEAYHVPRAVHTAGHEGCGCHHHH